jgi:two-component system response regulator PilR (NtrC family)
LTARKSGEALNNMRRLQAAAARKNFSALVTKSAAGERIKVTRYNKTAAARSLGISFRALRYRIKKLGIE